MEGFGVILRALKEKDLETVRCWRNSDHIREMALNRDHITKEQQQAWYRGVCEKDDEYFMVIVDTVPVGLIWVNQLDGHSETGFYIYETDRQNSLLPYRVVSLFHRYLFMERGFQSIYCKIIPENRRALRFNTSLGYVRIAQEKAYGYYQLTRTAFEKADRRITKLLGGSA